MPARALRDGLCARVTPDPQPCAAVQAAAAYLPPQGTALDLACGRGGNALWLARRGLRVDAWDCHAEAIAELRTVAERDGLEVRAEIRDVVAQPPEPDRYEVVATSYFLHRALMPALLAAVRPGGLLCYQTFLAGHPGPGPRNPDYLLQPGELAACCSGWKLLHTLEQDGQAQLVARRTAP